jgi:hypothetical protein
VDTVVPLAIAAPAAFWDPERQERVVTERLEIGALPLPTGRLVDSTTVERAETVHVRILEGTVPLEVVER